MRKRCRSDEELNSVDQVHLKSAHSFHEKWLQNESKPVLVLDFDQENTNEIEIETLKITVRDITDKDISSRNLNKNTTGAVIVNISNKSSLINLLSVNDIIVEVQKTPIKKSSDLNKIVQDIFKKGEKTLLLTIINKNNQRRYLGVKIN